MTVPVPANPLISDPSGEYLDDLWWLLHHSDSDDNFVLGLTSYFDDSGSDDGSPLVTIGGPVITRIQFKEFGPRWTKILKQCEVDGPLHMTDFVYPGKYCAWPAEFKRHLFLKVAKVINDHKFYSVAVMVSRDDFNSELSQEVKNNLIGPYAFTFFCSVLLTCAAIAESKFFEGRISYLVDDGFGHKDQLADAYSTIANIQRHSTEPRRVGTFGFAIDDDVPALQAADVIAWASRRKHLEGSLPEGFEPLNEIFERLHEPVPIPRHGVNMLAAPINNWITKYGSMPKLSDVIR
jgi:hypothetical protein